VYLLLAVFSHEAKPRAELLEIVKWSDKMYKIAEMKPATLRWKSGFTGYVGQ